MDRIAARPVDAGADSRCSPCRRILAGADRGLRYRRREAHRATERTLGEPARSPAQITILSCRSPCPARFGIKLQIVEFCVETALLHQLVVPAALHDASVINHEN